MESRICNVCKKNLLLSPSFWYRCSTCRDGYLRVCRGCISKKKALYYLKQKKKKFNDIENIDLQQNILNSLEEVENSVEYIFAQESSRYSTKWSG